MYVGARTGGGAGLTTSDLGDDDTDANIHALTMSNANLCFANIVLLFWHFFALLDEVVRFFLQRQLVLTRFFQCPARYP
jgi:hypothetical protein